MLWEQPGRHLARARLLRIWHKKTHEDDHREHNRIMIDSAGKECYVKAITEEGSLVGNNRVMVEVIEENCPC